MESIEKYINHGRDLRLAFNYFLADKGMQLPRVCELISKEGFGYKAMAKWLPSKTETIKDRKFKPEINNKKQLDRLAECIKECVAACGYALVNSKGEAASFVSDPDVIPFYDPGTKQLRVRKTGDKPAVKATALTVRGQFEANHPDCFKYLLLQADAMTGMHKSFLYLDKNMRRATLFAAGNSQPQADDYFEAANNTLIINHADTKNEEFRQIIFQKNPGNDNLYHGLYSEYRNKPGYPVCGNIILLKMNSGISENDPVFFKAFEAFLPDTK